MRFLFSFLTTIIICTVAQAQNEILFSVQNELKVDKEEFVYMYKKNNFNNKKGYTKEDIEDYLELYKIFKLKIVEAEHLGYDTTSAFKEEYNKYKEQLTQNYLRTNQITDSLIKEAYERYKEKVQASHILLRVDKNAYPADTLAVYNRTIEIRDKAISGANFGELAKQYSEDPSAKTNNGDLGYFTSMQMVYPFETAAYTTPIGNISNPVRTQFGYHIIKVIDKTTNEKIEVAHIMIRAKDNTEEAPKNKIFDIHDQLNNGVEWELLCKQFSEDNNTKNNGGKLKPFSAGQMPKEFQDIAFGLVEKGEYSDPFTTPYGWHIVKLVDRHDIESFEKMKPQIANRIKRDERVEISKKALLVRLKSENNFKKLYTDNLETAFDETLLQGKWINQSSTDFELFSINNQVYTFSNLAEYVVKTQLAVSGYTVKQYTDMLYNDFEEKSVMDYEKEHLHEKYIDYKMLVGEYREGIMLFNLMDDMVWSKAANDSTALKTYYNDNLQNYQWKERAQVTIYGAENNEIISEIKQFIILKDSVNLTKKALEEHYNQNSSLTLEIVDNSFEKGENEVLSQLNWQLGLQEITIDDRNYLVNIKAIIPPGAKTFNSIKGLVIADYQEKLEKQWVNNLKNKYTVQLNKKVFKTVIKELEK